MTHYRTGKFDSYVCTGDTATIEEGVFEIRATIYADEDAHPDDWEYAPEYCEAWQRGEWFFCGVSLSLWLGEVCVEKHAASLWGVACNLVDNSHLNEVVQELLPEAREAAKEKREYMLCLLEREYE